MVLINILLQNTSSYSSMFVILHVFLVGGVRVIHMIINAKRDFCIILQFSFIARLEFTCILHHGDWKIAVMLHVFNNF